MTEFKPKNYTSNEEKALEYLIEVVQENNNMNFTKLAKHLSPIFQRTPKGLANKISLIKNQKEGKGYRIPKKENSKFIFDEKKKDSIIINSIGNERSLDKEITSNYKSLSVDDVGQIYSVKVYNILPYGAFCITEEDKQGLLLKSYISNDFVHEINDYLKVGDSFEALVVPDKRNKGKFLFNAKIIGDIIPIKDR